MILIVDMNYRKESLGYYEFVLPIASIVSNHEKFAVKHFSEIKHDGTDDYRRIILSGAALKDSVYLDHVDEFEWVEQCDRPILGICAGIQVIGLVFGSSLERCLEIGMKEIRTIRENPLFSSAFKAYELHNHSIRPSTKFDVLAESDSCIQAVKHKKRSIYGVLFHPEVRNEEILERFILMHEE